MRRQLVALLLAFSILQLVCTCAAYSMHEPNTSLPSLLLCCSRHT